MLVHWKLERFILYAWKKLQISLIPTVYWTKSTCLCILCTCLHLLVQHVYLLQYVCIKRSLRSVLGGLFALRVTHWLICHWWTGWNRTDSTLSDIDKWIDHVDRSLRELVYWQMTYRALWGIAPFKHRFYGRTQSHIDEHEQTLSHTHTATLSATNPVDLMITLPPLSTVCFQTNASHWHFHRRAGETW